MAEPVTSLLLVLVGFLAWWFSTLGAGGGAILFLPVAGLLMDPPDIPLAIAVASAVSSVQRCWIYRRHIVGRVFAANLPGLVLGAVLGAWLLRGFDARAVSLAVGSFLVLYALSRLTGFGVQVAKPRPLHFGAASFVTSSVSTVVGAAGPLMNPVYLQAGILKEGMIGTKAASTLAMQLAKLGSFLAVGLMRPEVWWMGVLIGAGALAGNALGKRTLGRISTERFSRIVESVLLVTGAGIVARAWGG